MKELQGRIAALKHKKSTAKMIFTKARHKLIGLLNQDMPSRRKVGAVKDQFEDAQTKAMEVMTELSQLHSEAGNDLGQDAIADELEQLEREFTEAMALAEDYLFRRKDDASTVRRTTRSQIQRLQEDERRQQKKRDEMKRKRNMEKMIVEKNKLLERQRKEMEALEKKMMKMQSDHGDSNDGLSSDGDDDKGEEQSSNDGDDVDAEEDDVSDADGKDDGKEDGELHTSTKNYDRRWKKRGMSTTSPQGIGQDLWRQLKRVSIPVFNGDKRGYETWKSAFMACIDQAPATGEYKLLQLRQYLSGDALKAIEGLGHSSHAYEAAKERLERKYGGLRRKLVLYLDELDSFKPIREDQPKDLEKFADLLDVAVINLKENDREEELGNGTFYRKLQRKLPEKMLTHYQRWTFENKKKGNVETLRRFVIQEAEFQMAAAETLHGLHNVVGVRSLVRKKRRT